MSTPTPHIALVEDILFALQGKEGLIVPVMTTGGIRNSETGTLKEKLAEIDAGIEVLSSGLKTKADSNHSHLGQTPVVMTITPPATLYAVVDCEMSLTFTGSSLLLGGKLVRYRITFGSNDAITVESPDETYTGLFTPVGQVGDQYTIVVVGIDSFGNESSPLVLDYTIGETITMPPSLVTPIADSQIVRSSITIALSRFQAVLPAGTHESSQYRIRKTDGSVLYDSGEIQDLTTHTILESQLTGMGEEGCDILIDARYKSNFGWSAWGQAQSSHLIGKGTRIDGKATVIGLMTGYPTGTKDQWIAVLDAVYRGVSIKWGKYDMDLAELINPGTGQFTWVGGTIYANEPASSIVKKVRDPQTSKQNTDYLMTQNSGIDRYEIVGAPAAAYCETITINGTTAQLPNFQTLAFVFSRQTFIDENDPSAATNIEKKLRNWGFSPPGSGVVWASSEAGSSLACYVNVNGNMYSIERYRPYGVVPILEIPA